MKCLQCEVEATKVGPFWICPTHGHLAEPKPFRPLRIFLSYGHDSNEELVRCIKTDLEIRGHDVWFDKSEIKGGHDWRRSITEGIVDSHRILSFLSKHSTRDPGVCLDEIAIAIGAKGGNIQTILVESEQEVKPPVNIGHIQWLDMHEWKERRFAGEASWAQWYQTKLAEIVRVVESDESRRFAGEIELLDGYLKPIKSEAHICQLLNNGFYGRQWLFEAVEKWRQEPKSGSRLFWITGAPGVGKSAFAAQLTHTRGDIVIAAQFCEWDKPDHRNAQRVICGLAFQLATRLPDYRKLLLTLQEIAELNRKDAAGLFDYLLANPLRMVINGGRERYLIVIDALDEAGEAGRNPLVEMLARNAQRLPGWLGIVVTSRPEFDVKTPLQALNPFAIDTNSESNHADIRDYLRRELATQLQNCRDADRLVELILERSEGVFLYVERFCDDVHHGNLSLDRVEQFPQGLGGVFFQYFQRNFPDLEKFRKDARSALRTILAAHEPLPMEMLQRQFSWQDEEIRDFTRQLGSLFPVTSPLDVSTIPYDSAFPATRSLQYAASRGCRERIKPYHRSIAEWLADEAKAGPYFASVMEGHRMLADLGWQEFLSQPRCMTAYSVSHLPHHLIATKDVPRLLALLSDPWFWEYSRVFYSEEFYAEIVNLLSPSEAMSALSPAHCSFANQAAAKSPVRLGFALFPHEPGVTFINGTQRDGYSIPPGVVEPPTDVLWGFVKACDSTFASSSAFLRGARSSAVVDWYRDYWRDLQNTLDEIERYYDTHHAHLSYQAMYLSYRIDEALKDALAMQTASWISAS